MSVDKCKIHFNPDNLEIIVDRGTNLLSAAIAAGVHISASCNSLGVCGTCKIKIENGSVKSTRTDKLSQEEYDRGIRQACLCQVISDLIVNIPLESRVDRSIRAREKARSSGACATSWKFNPPVKKYLLNLPAASLSDNSNDYFRVMYGLSRTYGVPDWPIDFEVIRKMPAVLRKNNWQVTVTTLAISDRPPYQEHFTHKIIDIEAGDTRGQLYAIAIDVGTTTVSAQLLELNRGQILAEALVLNQQINHGADMLSRIEFSKAGGLKELQTDVVASINTALDILLASAKVRRDSLTYIATAGNTTMQHLLVGLDPQYILSEPYIPVANFIPLIKAYSLGINVPEHVCLFSFPNVSSYLGGDITANIVAAGIQQRKKLSLYIDIGTSGAVVIGNSEWMVSAACTDGPAFEGSGIKNGMVAVNGAIQDVDIDAKLEPTIKTIGDAPPAGICGAGLISLTASLLMSGVIGQNGLFNTDMHSSRIRKGQEGYEYILVKANQSATHQDIVITEKDIDKLIQAKAAIYAACCSLSQSVKVELSDFEQIILAGRFGSILNIEKAITIGLLPDVQRDRFVFVGNGSLSGTRLITFSTELLDDSRKVAHMMTDVELNDGNHYDENYSAALLLPHSDAKAFPSVIEKLKRAG